MNITIVHLAQTALILAVASALVSFFAWWRQRWYIRTIPMLRFRSYYDPDHRRMEMWGTILRWSRSISLVLASGSMFVLIILSTPPPS